MRWAVCGGDVGGLALRLVGGWTFAISSSYIAAFFTIPRTQRSFTNWTASPSVGGWTFAISSSYTV